MAGGARGVGIMRGRGREGRQAGGRREILSSRGDSVVQGRYDAIIDSEDRHYKGRRGMNFPRCG